VNQREARRKAWRAAYNILLDIEMPVSAYRDGDTPESENSAANHARFREAWNTILAEIQNKGLYPWERTS
jgi:hypothetical protein